MTSKRTQSPREHKPPYSEIGLLIVWLLLLVSFWIRLPQTFLSPANIESMMRQTIVASIAAMGMTWIIARGAIDLSVGSIVALSTVVVAKVLETAPPIVACMAAVATGMICGLLNGILTSRLKVGAFIITLAGLLIYRGVAKGIAKDSVINAPQSWITTMTKKLDASQEWMLIPSGAWLMLILVAACAFALKATVFGRRVIATGSNENTARLCGINPDRMTLLVFLIGGALFGIAGLLQFARLGAGDPTVAQGLELTVIAAVVIGGASLSGGTGSMWGSFFGTLIIQTLSTGCTQLGLDAWIQEIITGAIIVGAVTYDRWRLRRAETR